LALVNDGSDPDAFEDVQIKLAGIDIKQPGGEWIDLHYGQTLLGGNSTHSSPQAGAVNFKAVSPGTYHLEYEFRFEGGGLSDGRFGEVTVAPGTKAIFPFKKEK
jgi:hypothetical protein